MAGIFNKMVDDRLGKTGQEFSSTKVGNTMKIIYPAKVISTQDPFDKNRIIVEIISISNDGKEEPGEDRMIPKDKLPFCIPMLSTYLHVRAFEGEMVWIMCENPKDLTSIRYWMGPIISSKSNLKGESYLSSNSIFEKTEFNLSSKAKDKTGFLSVMPAQGDIALQGRDDADVILKPREVYITAGKFKTGNNNFEINNITPLYIQLKQYDGVSKNPYSQTNISATNINVFSNLGKFRDPEQGKKYETANTDLSYLGELANSLHPAVFGDELIKLLDLMIKIILNHVHTPQKALVPNSLSSQLSEYTIDGNLQTIISKFFRIN